MVDSLDWDDDEVTRPQGAALVPVVPFNPRIRIIGSPPSETAEGASEEASEEESAPTTRERAGDPFDERETTERDRITPVDPDAVAISPIVSVDGPALPTWEDVTVPRHSRDLRERAKRLAELSKGVDPEPSPATDEEPAVEAIPVVPVEGRDTIVDARPAAPEGPRVVLRVDEDRIGRGDELPVTLPRDSSFPDPSAPMRSVEIDLSGLEPVAEEEQEVFPKPVTDWRPLEEHAVITEPPRARRAHELKPSVPPVTMSSPTPSRRRRRRGVAIAALGVMLILCSTIFALWLLPKKGGVVVRLRTADGHPAAKAEIFLDGQKRCDTDPCVIEGLTRGDRTIKVIVPGSDEPRVASVRVRSGEHQTVWIDVPSKVQAELEAPPAEPVEPTLTVDLKTPRARVVIVPDGEVGRVLSGPFPREIDLPLGRYEVVASLHGYLPFVDRVELTEKAPAATVEVELFPRASAPATQDSDGDASETEVAREPESSKATDPAYWDPYADVEWD